MDPLKTNNPCESETSLIYDQMEATPMEATPDSRESFSKKRTLGSGEKTMSETKRPSIQTDSDSSIPLVKYSTIEDHDPRFTKHGTSENHDVKPHEDDVDEEDEEDNADVSSGCGHFSEQFSSVASTGAAAGGSPQQDITLELIFSKLQILPAMDKKLDRLEPLENEVKKLKTELKHYQTSLENTQAQLSNLTETVVSLKDDVAQAESERQRLHSEIVLLRKQNKVLEDRAIRQEAYSRRENILIHGVQESRSGNESCNQVVEKIFQELEVGPFNLTRCHRIGQYKNPAANQSHPSPRPIIVRFSHFPDKVTVMKKSQVLNAKNIFLSDDYPTEIQARRLKLKPVFRAAKNVDNNAKLVQDQIIFQKQRYTVENIESIPLDTKAIGTIVTDSHVYFKGSYSPLSNMYSCKLEVNGHEYSSSEQLYQFKKSVEMGQKDTADKVLATQDPYQAMALGRNVRTDEAWAATKGTEIMMQTLQMKYEQVPEFRNLIQQYADKTLVEASTNKTWGSGIDLNSKELLTSKWSGKNLLGKTLAKLAQ